MVKQISVFLENKSGRLASVTGILGKAGIDISALSIADTADFGILRLIVNDPERALATLKDEGFTVAITDVIAISAEDKPGGLNRVLSVLADGDIDIEYLYAFVGKRKDEALVILRLSSFERGLATLISKGIKVLSKEDVYNL